VQTVTETPKKTKKEEGKIKESKSSPKSLKRKIAKSKGSVAWTKPRGDQERQNDESGQKGKRE